MTTLFCKIVDAMDRHGTVQTRSDKVCGNYCTSLRQAWFPTDQVRLPCNPNSCLGLWPLPFVTLETVEAIDNNLCHHTPSSHEPTHQKLRCHYSMGFCVWVANRFCTCMHTQFQRNPLYCSGHEVACEIESGTSCFGLTSIHFDRKIVDAMDRRATVQISH